MAERRMFAKSIIDSDAFLDMPLSTQALYFHLAMRADDDGFVNNPKKISKMLGANEDEFKVLLAKKFLLIFENGVIVIKHWKVHNYIQKDRYKPTNYTKEMQLLGIKENNVYSLDTQVSIGKDRLGKNSIGKISKKIYPEDKIIADIILIYKNIFKKDYRLSFPEQASICKIASDENYTLEDWRIIFKNAFKGWKIEGKSVKPSLSNILENYSKFLNNDYNLEEKQELDFESEVKF